MTFTFSPTGLGVCRDAGSDLAARHSLGVSGMARGIDSCGHKALLPRARQPVEEILSTGGAIVGQVPYVIFPAGPIFRAVIASAESALVFLLWTGEGTPRPNYGPLRRASKNAFYLPCPKRNQQELLDP